MIIHDSIERLIINGLLNDDEYARKVLPILKDEYFIDEVERHIFSNIKEFLIKYSNLPSKEAILIQISGQKGIHSELYNQITSYVSELVYERPPNKEFLIQQTDTFAKDKAFYIALRKSLAIVEDKTGHLDKGMAMQYMKEALSVSLDPNVGHSYTEDWEKRYAFMHRHVEKIPFDLDFMNKITQGGVEKKTLNILLAGTGVGKTLFMCHLAAASFIEGKKVLYITLEMSEEKINERIDANLMNVTLDDLKKLPKDMWDKKIEAIKNKSMGKIQVKEYPTAQASTIHFRTLLNELNLKKNFVPDIIFLDYLNIAISSRIKPGSQVNTYQFVKSIAEELRGLAVEYNVPIWSATQTNRAGFNNTDVGLENTSESFGVPATADFMIALTRTEELDKLCQMQVTQLKNRYGDITKWRRFIIGVDRSKMRLYDAEQKAQEDLHDSGRPDDDKPGFDKTGFGQGMKAEKKNFGGIKFGNNEDDGDENF